MLTEYWEFAIALFKQVSRTNNGFQRNDVTLVADTQNDGTHFLFNRLFLNLLFILFFRFVPKDPQLLGLLAQISYHASHSTMGNGRVIKLFLLVLHENLVQLVDDFDDFVESALNQE